MALRDPEFRASFEAFRTILADGDQKVPENKVISADFGISNRQRLRIAIVHSGAPAGGMNTATRAAARLALNRGHTPVVINNGFAGLIAGDLHELNWMDVENWTVAGGSALGTNRSQPEDDIGLCAYQLQKQNINALMIIGGFEGFTALNQLNQARKIYPAFCIPMILIPATISNNVPGTEFSLGSDTALNVIVEACDRIRQSAYSSRKRVFVVEVQGGKCGFLATMAGIACGATCAYIPEEGVDLQLIANDCAHLIRQFKEGQNQGRVILRNECTSDTYTTDVISSIFREEGRGVFDARASILGHIQQGGAPSPLDRVRATRMAVKCIHWIETMAFPAMELHDRREHSNRNNGYTYLESDEPRPNGGLGRIGVPLHQVPSAQRLDVISNGVYTSVMESAAVIGIRGTSVQTTPVEKLLPEADFKQRKAKSAWWLELNGLIRILAKCGYREN
jgi:6-phosphofructokinase 1